MDIIQGIIIFFSSNHWVQALVTVSGLLSIPLSIFFYIKSLKIKKPSYYIRSITFASDLKDNISKLILTYDGVKIEKLSITRFMFINLGADIINREDIAIHKPLKISLPDTVKIFQAEVLYAKDSANDFNFNCVNNDILVTFDYLSKNEGGIIQFVHTGVDGDVKIDGTIKGGNGLSLLKTNLIRTDYFELVIQFLFSFIVFMTGYISVRFFYISFKDPATYVFILIMCTLTMIVYSRFIMKRIIYGKIKEYLSAMEQPWKT